ncbi:hypothetical protein T01_4537 [Trichinella spiralis]|uniref:Uncharacterized protein n=1 Tax=Trichinella spiralis TaxID=6334 RepID=A0A0V1BMX4_TRISP|nr:hypothetical protein T01_4537 [Trichinella spiralis]
MLKNFNNFNNVVGNGSWDGYLCQSGVAEVPASAFRLCCMMLRCDIGVEAKSAIVQVCSELKHAQSEMKDKGWFYSVPLFSHWSLPTLFY